jgi:hypothetical protein
MTPRRFSSRNAVQKEKQPGKQAAVSTSTVDRSNGIKKGMASPCWTLIDILTLLAASMAEFVDTKVNKRRGVVVSEANPAQNQKGTDPSNVLRQTLSTNGP